MTWTRRQFGLWSSAALLTSHPALAAAPGPKLPNDPGPQVDPPQRGQDLSPITLTLQLASNEARKLAFDVMARNEGEAGLTFSYELTDATLVDATGVATPLGAFPSDTTAIAYFEERHPFARRLMVPSYVDVGPGKAIALEQLELSLPETRPKGSELRLTVSLYEGIGEAARHIALVVPWPGAPDA